MPGATDKTKSTIKNASVSILLQIVVVLAGLMTKSLIIRNYGREVDGVIVTVNMLHSYLNLVAIGLSTASIQALYAPLARNNWEEINSVMSASNHFYNKTANIFSMLVVVVSAGYAVFMRNELPAWLTAGSVLVMGLSGSIEYYLYDKYQVFLTADQKLYVVTSVTLFGTIVQTVLKLVLASLQINILLVQLIPAVIYFLRVLFLMFYVKRKYPLLNRKAKPNYQALNKRWSVFMHQIAGLVVNNTDVLMLTLVTKNPVLISIYGMYNLVFSNLFTLMSNSFSHGALASFGQLIATDDMENVRKGYSGYEFSYYFIVAVIYSITAVMILPFIRIYSKNFGDGPSYFDPLIAFLFVVISLANNLRVPGVTMISAKGHFKETQNRALIEAAINLISSFLLVWKLGIYGVLLGTVLSFAYRTIDIILYSNKKILQQPAGRTLKRGLTSVVIVIASVVVCYRPMLAFTTDWFHWILGCILVGGFSFLLAGGANFLLERQVMKDVYQRIMRTIFHKSSPKKRTE